MAHMYPEDPPEGYGRLGEKALHIALKRALNDEFFVYSNLRYLGGRQVFDGECDFLVLHRELGALFIECKGKGVYRDGQGNWWRGKDKNRKPLKKPPEEQARRIRYDMIELLEKRQGKEFPELNGVPFIHGWAVAFPVTDKREVSQDPLGLPHEVVFTGEDMKGLDERIRGALAYWRESTTRSGTPLSQRRFKHYRRNIIYPELGLACTVGAGIRAEREVLVHLTGKQREAVERYMENRRFRVPGGAGTGKTVLAVEAVRRHAARGRSVLLLCYNKALGRHLADTVTAQCEGAEKPVRAVHFPKLCNEAHEKLYGEGVAPPGDEEKKQKFWEDDAPVFLLEAVERGLLPHYDAIVVDEAQDFAASWWSVLEELLTDAKTGRILAFYDAAQEIFGRGCHVPEDWAFLGLNENLRNTQRIAEVVNALGGEEMVSPAGFAEGEPPVVRQVSPGKQTVVALEDLMGRLVTREGVDPDQIVIQTPHSKKNSSLAGLDEIAGVEISGNPAERSRAVLHSSISAFKGLESDVVILADIDSEDERCDRHARYVAASRARHRLYVFAKGDWLG